MSKPETEKLLRIEATQAHTDWLLKGGDERTTTEFFNDFWLNKMKEQREKMIESISEDITNYDEVYISEDVRKAINRMKFNLKSIIKNKE